VLGSNSANPYQILGVTRNDSQEIIRRRYRELCLKYHPDKNVHCSDSVREQRSEKFKEIQKAFSLIGNADNRREYDAYSTIPTFSRSHRSGSDSEGGGEPNFYAENPFSFQWTPRHYNAFYFFGSPLGGMARTTRSDFDSFDTTGLFSQNLFKAKFIHRVKIPLKDLYSGKKAVGLTANTSFWNRFFASYRGGIAYIYLYEAAVYALPLSRLLNSWIAAGFAFFLFCRMLDAMPLPKRTIFTVPIHAGYKEGTKIIFRTQEKQLAFEFIFILCEDIGQPSDEGNTETYRRVGDDLHVVTKISHRQAKQGCMIKIAPLDEEEDPIQVEIPPNFLYDERASFEGQTGKGVVIVQGRGWPIRKTDAKGDLFVHVEVSQHDSYPAHRRRKRRVGTKKQSLQESRNKMP